MPEPAKPPLIPEQVPYTGPYSLPSGEHRSRGLTAKALKIAMKRMGEEPFAGKDNSIFDEHYNANLEAALDRTTNASWNGYGEKRWEVVRALRVTAGRSGAGEYALNKEARDLILKDYVQMNQTKVPDLGPLWNGGKSVLEQAPTHKTSGLLVDEGGLTLWPAYDDAFKAGTTIIAPEPLVVTRQSSSNPGDAFYADGDSEIEHWFGHLVSAPADGKRFVKGEKIGVVLDHNIGGGPHVHHALNIERLFGKGEQLEWGADGDGPDYTHGSPTIREQLGRRLG